MIASLMFTVKTGETDIDQDLCLLIQITPLSTKPKNSLEISTIMKVTLANNKMRPICLPKGTTQQAQI